MKIKTLIERLEVLAELNPNLEVEEGDFTQPLRRFIYCEDKPNSETHSSDAP